MGTPAADDLWAKVAAAVRAQLSEATWNTWFQGVHALDCTDETLMLGVPSSVAVERIRTSYLGLLADAVQALTGVPHTIELIVDTAPRADADDAPRAAAPTRPVDVVVERHRGSGARARQRVAQHPAESPLHVRPVRHRRLEPLRPRRRAERRREPGPVVQPAVHLRAGRARQDPPAARDRPPRARAVLEQAHPLRLDRDDDERIRRRDALEGHARASNGATARSTCCSSTTSSSSSAPSSSRRSSSTRSTTCTAGAARS